MNAVHWDRQTNWSFSLFTLKTKTEGCQLLAKAENSTGVFSSKSSWFLCKYTLPFKSQGYSFEIYSFLHQKRDYRFWHFCLFRDIPSKKQSIKSATKNIFPDTMWMCILPTQTVFVIVEINVIKRPGLSSLW